MYYVYILLSELYPKTYVGLTDNVFRRLNEHNDGYSVYTKRYKPWKLLHTEKVKDRGQARKREKYLKTAAGRKWIVKALFTK